MDVLAARGQPIVQPLRGRMEARFGHSFADVRIHADDRAAAAADSLGAKAYTDGRHVAFGRGHDPTTPKGEAVLAHELGHVVATARAGATIDPRRINPADHASERDPLAAAPIGLALQRTNDPAPVQSPFDQLLPLLGRDRVVELQSLIAADAQATALVAQHGAPAILALDQSRDDRVLKPADAASSLSKYKDSFDPQHLRDVQSETSQLSFRARLLALPTLNRALPTPGPAAPQMRTLDASAYADHLVATELTPAQQQDQAMRRAKQNEARTVGGSFERNNNAIFLNASRADGTAVVHEHVHSLSHPEFQRRTNTTALPFLEGATHFFAQRAVDEMNAPAQSSGANAPAPASPKDFSYGNSYPNGTRLAGLLNSTLGGGILERAYFRGEFEALVRALDNRLGSGTYAEMERLLADGRDESANAAVSMLGMRIQLAPASPRARR